MTKTYNYSCAIEFETKTLSDEKIKFTHLYVETWNSLLSFQKSHKIDSTNKNSIKVTASAILQNPAIWIEAIKYIREKQTRSEYQKHILANWEKCTQVNNGNDPVKIFQIYSKMIDVDECGCQEPDEQLTDEKAKTQKQNQQCETVEVSEEDANPLNVIKKLAYSYSFFIMVNRNYFILGIRDAIRREVEYMEILAKKNKDWYRMYQNLNNLLIREIGVNLNLIVGS